MIRVLVVLPALAALALLAPSAQALPGDPPIEQLSPADGATVALSPEGIVVAYTCGLYRKSDFGTAVHQLRRLQRQLQRALLTTHPDGGTRFIAGGFDTSPVRSFAIESALSNLRLTAPTRAYAGYPLTLGVRVDGDPDAPPLTVELRRGAAWVPLAPQNLRPPTISASRAAPVVSLPAGRQRLRAVITQGQERTVSSEITVAVRAARAWTTVRSAGRYQGGPRGQPVRARVAKGGRSLLGFEAQVSASCVRPSTLPGQAIETTFLPGVAPVPNVRIAPDGRFTVVKRYRGTTVELSGRVVGSRITGRVGLEVGDCSGGYAFTLGRTT